MATAFLGYQHSPISHKYNSINFNINNNNKQRRSYSSCPKSEQSPILNKFLIDKGLNPIKTYEDLHLKETSEEINRYCKGKSGIYLILNKISLDYYIGSASTNRLYSRYQKHLIGLTGSKIVKLAVRKYKLENFSFIILEEFPEIITKENNKNLLDLEDFYLKSLLPNYNILTEAGNSFGYKHTELDRIKMKAIYSEERRLQIGNLNKGKQLTNETKESMKESALNRLPRSFSDEALANMKKASNPLVLYNKDGTVYGEYESIIEASVSANCSVKTIYRVLISDSKMLKRR